MGPKLEIIIIGSYRPRPRPDHALDTSFLVGCDMEEHRELFSQRIRESEGDASLVQTTFQEAANVADNDKKSIFEQSFHDEMHALRLRYEQEDDMTPLKQLVLLAVVA